MTSSYELALARSRGYGFLSHLWLHGVTPDVAEIVALVPDLGAALGAVPVDLDQLAAAHQQILGFDVFPFQSIFLDPSGLLGGAETDRVLGAYAQAGFAFATADTPGDHVGHQLAFLAFLCGAEADAWEDGVAATAQRVQGVQAAFLRQHLLRWIVPLVLAVKQQAHPLFTALADLTLAQAADHTQDLAAAVAAAVAVDLLAPAALFALPKLPDLLADEKTSLKDIGELLLRPVFSGLYLSRDDLARLGRSLDLPRGFGDRGQMLTNLMRAAVTYELWETLIREVRGRAEAWREAYVTLGVESPVLAEFVRPWIGQIDHILVTLDSLARQKLADPRNPA